MCRGPGVGALSVAADGNVTPGTAGQVAITATNSSSRPAGRPRDVERDGMLLLLLLQHHQLGERTYHC